MSATEVPAPFSFDCAVALAEAAIEGNDYAECFDHHLVAVSDIVIIEGAANGRHVDPESTWRLYRDDGRVATLHRIPAEVVS